ncbi:MAG: hypothetical protein ACFE8B_01525 [Candidatus Hermodarchaeota archaeon]
MTQEEWLEIIDSKAKDEHGAFTQEFEKIVDLCLKEQVFLNLIELSGAQDKDAEAIFSTLDTYLDENFGSLIEQLFSPLTFEAFISEVINQVLNNMDNEGFVNFNVPTQEYFDQILEPESFMLMHDGGVLLPILNNLKMIKEHKGEINFLCDFIYRLENLFQEDILFEGLGDLPIPSDYVDRNDNNMIKNNFLKMQGPSETRPYSVVYLKQILKVLKLSMSDLQKISWITTNPNGELEFNKIYEKRFYRTMLEHIQNNINDPLLSGFTIVQGLMFSSDEFKITDEDFYIIEIVDSVLNELFGHIGYSLLQMGLMTCGLDGNGKYTIDFKIQNQEHLNLLKEIIKDSGINSFVELDTLQISDSDYVNLILGVLLTGYFKEIKIRNEAGNLIDIRRINTFPHSSFLEEVFQNYRYEDFNNERVYNLMFRELFIDHFIGNRIPLKFFRINEFYNEILFFRLPSNTKNTKANTIGIVEIRGGLKPIKNDNGQIINWIEEDVGRIVWLELGNQFGGLEHILSPALDYEGIPIEKHKKGHFAEFYDWSGGFLDTPYKIAHLILGALSNTQYRVDVKGRKVFQVNINGLEKYIVIGIGPNGYILTAHPYDTQDGRDLFSNNP